MSFNEMEYGEAINQALSKRWGVQGPPAGVMASEVFPVLPMDGPGIAPEYHFLANTRMAGGWGTQAAVAGQYSHVGLSNPEGSNAIIVVTDILITNSNGFTAQAFAVTTEVGNPIASSGGSPFRDTRWGGTGRTSAGYIWTGANAVQYGDDVGFIQIDNVTQGTRRYPGQWVLGPGGYVAVRTAAVNLIATAAFNWHERAAAPGELQGAIVI